CLQIGNCKATDMTLLFLPISNIRFGPKTQKISENILVTSFTVSEQRKRTKIPTKLGFHLFLGGMSRSTWKSYEIREDFLDTVEAINNFFEWILESGGLEGTMNPQMVQFVLNTSYGRNPKQLQENMEYSFTGIEIADVTQEDIEA
ncbi:MAG: terminase small subunit, partial [Candidatus Absconditicoccaceae bacterium]